MLATVNQLDQELHQMDVKTAFLNGDFEEEIFMKQPKGFTDKNHPSTRFVNCRKVFMT